jgi:hypothetical protein
VSGASEHMLLLRRRRKRGLSIVKQKPKSRNSSGSGGMAEWFKAAVLKTASRKSGRGFESYSLRHALYVQSKVNVG